MLFYNVEETFVGCAPSIITLALCIAASNVYIKSRRRTNGDTTVPEMQCKVAKQTDGQLSIDPQPLYANDRSTVAQAHAVEFAVPTLFKIMSEGKVSTLSTYYASHRSMPFIAANAIDEEDGVDTPSTAAEFVFEALHKQFKYYALSHGNVWNMRTIIAATIDQIIRYVRTWTDGGPPEKAKLDGKVKRKKKRPTYGLDCNPNRNSAVVCPCCCSFSFPAHCRCSQHGAFGKVSDDVIRIAPEDDMPGIYSPGIDARDAPAGAEDEPERQYDPVQFEQLEPNQHVEIKWEGSWVPAFVKTISGAVARLHYPGPPEEIEDVSKADFNNKRQTEARVMRGDAPPAPWLSAIDVPDFTPTVSPGDSYHSAQIRALKYDPSTRKLGEHTLPATVGGQVRSNLKKAVSSTVTKLGKQYHMRVGQCEVFGQAAISQRLLADIKSCGKTLAELERGHTWSTAELLPGKYALSVGTEMVLITVTETRAVSSAMPTDTTIECHMVQVEHSAWRRYGDGDVNACIECVTNGCKPLMVCVCDLQNNPHCPRSKTSLENIDPVLQRNMDPAPSAHTKLDLERLPLFSKILKQIIHYEFSLWCMGKQTDQPTGESVYGTMTSHCGHDWVRMYCGSDRELTVALFEKQLVHWLQDHLDGQRSTKKRKGLVDRLRWSWDQDSAPVFFIGQRIYARWTSERGTLVATVNRTAEDERGFAGTIAAEGEAPGFWRVGFDGEPDHPGIPAKYITPREDVSDEASEGM